MFVNSCVLAGRVGKVKRLQEWVALRLVVNRGEGLLAEWFDVEVPQGPLAEFVSERVRVGDELVVQGNLHSRPRKMGRAVVENVFIRARAFQPGALRASARAGSNDCEEPFETAGGDE